MKILRKLIEIENKDEKAYENHIPCYEWDPDTWVDFQADVEERQNQLCDLGLISVIGNLISSHHTNVTLTVKYETFNLAISLLLGGNTKVQ